MAIPKSQMKRRETPSSKRKKANIRHQRKRRKRQEKANEPNWVEALKSKYAKKVPGLVKSKSGGKKIKAKTTKVEEKRKPWQRRSKPKPGSDYPADDDDNDDDLPPSDDYDDSDDAAAADDPNVANEIESDVDEEKVNAMNERFPLEAQLFLKGIPSDVDEAHLQSVFNPFGRVLKVHIVKNSVTERANGSAFVHFKAPEGANAAYEHAQQNARELAAEGRDDLAAKTQGMTHHQAKKLQFKLQQQKFTLKDPFVVIGGTRVTILRALSRMESQDLTSGGKDKKKQNRTVVGADDPRNLYLLEEGRIRPGSPAAQDLNPRFLQSLEQDYESRVQQMKNVNMFVSKTRLSFRNLPRDVESKQLRALCLEQVREFLTKHPEMKQKKKAWGKYGPIKNIRVLVNPSTGLSKGYGFVEFVQHEFALHTLRKLNNNPTLYGKNRRPVVSFAVENANALQKLERLKALKKQKEEMKKAAGGGFYDEKSSDSASKPSDPATKLGAMAAAKRQALTSALEKKVKRANGGESDGKAGKKRNFPAKPKRHFAHRK